MYMIMLILYFEPQNHGECGALVVEHQTPKFRGPGFNPQSTGNTQGGSEWWLHPDMIEKLMTDV